MERDLRPLSLGELLDRSFTYYREHFWIFVGIVAPAEALVIASTLVFQVLGYPSALNPGPQAAGSPPGASQVFSILGASMVIYVFGGLAHSVALAVSSSALSRIQLGEAVTVAEAYRSLRGSVGRLAGLLVLYSLIVLGAYLILAVFGALMVGIGSAVIGPAALSKAPAGLVVVVLMVAAIGGGGFLAMWFCLRYALAIPALVLERLGSGRALTRSSRLAKGSLGRIFLSCVLMFLIVMVITFAFEVPFWAIGMVIGFKFGQYPIWLRSLMTLSGGMGATFGYPVLFIVLPLLYYDARVRKEAFDLQVMVSSLGPGTEVVTEPFEHLNSFSVVLMILLTLVTFGLYVPVWFLMRRRTLNYLNTPNKLNAWLPALALTLEVAAIVLRVVLRDAGTLPPNAALLVLALSIAAALGLILQAFKVRRVVEEHLTARRRNGTLFVQPEPLSAVATFFLGVYYLQYKINELLDEINAAIAVPIPDPQRNLTHGAVAPPAQ